MPNKPCFVCTSGLKARVEAALAAGQSVRDIASDTGISKSAVGRHRIECWKGHTDKVQEKILRTEDRKRSYENAITEESENGTLVIEGEVTESTGQIVKYEPKALLRCPIRNADDLVGQQYEGLQKVWKVLEKASEQYESDPSAGKARVVIMAAHEWNVGLMAIGKVKGIVTDAPQTTNQTLNVYNKMTDEELERRKAQIDALIDEAKKGGLLREDTEALTS